VSEAIPSELEIFMPGQKKDRRRGGKDLNAEDAKAVARAERTAVFGKTKLCKFYILGCCTKGKACCFAHDQSEMNPAPDLSRTKICKTLINTGICNDPDCTYAHNKEELRDMPTVETLPQHSVDTSAQSKRQQSKVPPAPDTGLQSSPPDHAQAMLMQQQAMLMMSSPAAFQMMSQMIAAQQQCMGRPVPIAPQQQSPGALAGEPFLYNALFQQATEPSTKLDNEMVAIDDSSKVSDTQPLAMQCPCGTTIAPNAKYCLNCGSLCQDTAAKKYNVKNTFVEIDDPIVNAAKKASFPKWQSATDLLMYCDDSPINSSPLSQRLPRVNTWASDLGKVEEESPRDSLDMSPKVSADGEETFSEKRLQDTPFPEECVRITEFVEEEWNPNPINELPTVDSIRIKNTFIEIGTEPSRKGMRMVQTASGRLDLLGRE
jgi:hypothetical protein